MEIVMELKLCPFCGGAGKVHQSEKGVKIVCENHLCPCETFAYSTVKEAADKWNTRTPEKEHKALTKFASIKAMSIDEMVDLFFKNTRTCDFCERRGMTCVDVDCKVHIKHYLESEAD